MIVTQLARQPLIPTSMLFGATDELQPRPARDADPLPDQPATGATDDVPTERSWIDELAAALRELARRSIGRTDDDEATEQESTDEQPL